MAFGIGIARLIADSLAEEPGVSHRAVAPPILLSVLLASVAGCGI
jgi:hypothetical protein